MYVRRDIRPGLIFRFAWKNLLRFAIWSGLITLAYILLLPYGIDIRVPFLPLSTIGTAVAFYLGFKNSHSYERFWEARKLWGGIVNQSRLWGSQVRGYISNRHATLPLSAGELHARHQEIIYRQLAWINALRIQLRRTNIYDRQNISHTPKLAVEAEHNYEPQIGQFLQPAEYEAVMSKANPATQLLNNQSQALQQLLEDGLIEDFRHIDLMTNIKELFALQGGCERIKNTPLPRQFAYFSTVFVWLFVLLLPFGLVGEFSKLNDGNMVWLTVPFSILVSWVFTTMEIVGDNSEDPFENYVNDVPMTALCRTIEIDLREMLHETDLPARIVPVNDILL